MSRRHVRLSFLSLNLLVWGVNCCLEHPEPPAVVYQCRATIQDADGRVERVSSGEVPFSRGGRLVGRFCADTLFPESLPAYWTRRLRRGIEFEPRLTARGPWCIERIACEAIGPASNVEPCPEHLDLPPLEQCPAVASCLEITPGPNPADPGFESWVAFPNVAAGGSASVFVTIKNICPTDVQLRLDPRYLGANASDFSMEFPGCAPRATETGSRRMASLESCTFQATFRPQAGGLRGARLVVGHDLRMNQQIAFRGTGEAGTLRTPDSVCLAGPLTPVPECPAGASAFRPLTLTNSGTRPVTVESIASQAPQGQFQTRGAALPFAVAPGATTTIEVRWCRGSVDGNVLGALAFTTNGTPRVVFAPVDRSPGGCA